MNWINVNLNNSIKVRLTERGIDIWHNRLVDNSKTLPLSLRAGYVHSKEELRAKADQQGYTEFRIWDFINLFGGQFRIGFDNPIENMNVLVQSTTT